MIPHKILESVLNQIELKEQVALSWGITDVGVAPEELEQFVAQAIELHKDTADLFLSVEDVISQLRDFGLIYLFGEGASREAKRYRSRMAETVRLLFLLRQQFPKHRGQEKWQTAKRLVSDFRFARVNRKFPKRSMTTEEAKQSLAPLQLSQSHKECLDYLLDSYGQSGFSFAQFQIDATGAISSRFETPQNSITPKSKDYGVIVTAGTGSGKTLSFYLPVLARIASRLCEEQDAKKYWMQCLAIYPRVELQKDQFKSTIQEARRLSEFLAQKGKRKIRLGLLYSSTPPFYSGTASDQTYEDLQKIWKRGSRGFVCPHFKCWERDCDKPLIWPFDSIRQRKEELVCSDPNCGNKIGADEIALTRSSIQRFPPDILFTSSEMLNRNLSNNSYRAAFGGRKEPYSPEFLLVDEAHLYSSAYGAQFAYLIRRWRSQLPRFSTISIVGLSATLIDADKFFERLTGLSTGRCHVISPNQRELEVEGIEYLISLKGDPLSKTALLSTTIQANMLLSRMLDRTNSEISQGMFGTKAFTFADDIDVANRLYYYMQDAEGFGYQNQFGAYAQLRDPSPSLSKKQEGQDWEFPELISGSLANGKIVERVSSQDKGLDPNSEIVIATSSLEVGFDDPQVGAVIQHKSPRNFSGFLQRKGRGGRTRKMRPWTSIILSDYGRDRLTFQSYEQVFDPEIEPSVLPLESMHIKRIQAAYFLLDFLSKELNFSDETRGIAIWKRNIWNLVRLSSKADSDERFLQQFISNTLETIISNTEFHSRFVGQLSSALKLNSTDLDIILWEHPRPLMTSLIPALLRLLNVELRGEISDSFQPPDTPLEEFLPSALFSDLNLPELTLTFPNEETKEEKMPVLQGLKSFAPGRVSKRFAVRFEKERHWLEVIGMETGNLTFQIEGGTHQFRKIGNCFSDGEDSFELFRPLRLELTVPPKNIKDSSNSIPIWETQFELSPQATSMPVTEKHGPASRIFKSVSVHTHSSSCPANVRRFFRSLNASLKKKSQADTFTTISVKHGARDAAIGYEIQSDAIVFDIDFKDLLSPEIVEVYKKNLPKIRTARYFDEAENADVLSHIPNPFLRGWVARIFFDTLCFEALKSDQSIDETARVLLEQQNEYNFSEILDRVFQSIDYSTDESEISNIEESEFEREEKDYLREEILNTLKLPETKTRLSELAQILVADIDKHLSWILTVASTTLAKIVACSVHQLVPHFEENDVVVDVVKTVSKQESKYLKVQLVISELSPGGIGHIEEVADKYALDPRMFFQTICSNSTSNNHELVDAQLREVVNDLALGSSPLNPVFTHYRDSFRGGDVLATRDDVLRELKNTGRSLFHSFLTTLFSRVLRPGSSVESDQLFSKIFSYWTQSDSALGVEIDSRVISFLFATQHSKEIDLVLNRMNYQSFGPNPDNFRTNVLNSLIWPSGAIVRNLHISAYNPFEQKVPVERIILEPVLIDKARIVDIEKDGWEKLYQSIIANHGTVNVVCTKTNTEKISAFLNFVAVEPVYQDYLKVFARVSRIAQENDLWKLTLELPEVVQ